MVKTPESPPKNGQPTVSQGLFVLGYWLRYLSIPLLILGLPFLLLPINRSFRRTQMEHRNLREIPVAADKFASGVALLSPRKAAALTVFFPDPKGTPLAQLRTYGEVKGVLEGAKPVVVLAIPGEIADEFQKALVNDESQVVYELLPSLPTRTPTPTPHADTPAPTSTPTGTPAPQPGSLYVEVSIAELSGHADRLAPGTGNRLVVISKTENQKDTPVPDATISQCVVFQDFLDASGIRLGSYLPGRAQALLLELPDAQLVPILTALARAERVYLLPDPTCVTISQN